MKKILFLTGALFCLAFQGFCQLKTYLGGGVSITNDKYGLVDPGGSLKIGTLINGTYGITLGQEFNQNFVLETGATVKEYSEGFHFKEDYSNSSGGSMSSLQIPLRVKSRLNLFRDKVFFTTTAGYVFGLNSFYFPGLPGGTNASIGWGETTIGDNSYSFSYSTNTNFRKTFSLVQAGLGLDFLIRKKIIIALSSSYLAGLNNIMRMDINYQKANGDVAQKATVTGKGSYWNYGITASYPVSDLWSRKN